MQQHTFDCASGNIAYIIDLQPIVEMYNKQMQLNKEAVYNIHTVDQLWSTWPGSVIPLD